VIIVAPGMGDFPFASSLVLEHTPYHLFEVVKPLMSAAKTALDAAVLFIAIGAPNAS
jgi:hypothetical protein